MKTFFLVCTLFIVSFSFGQEDKTPSYKNEFSSNLFDLVVGGSLNLNYERLLDKNQSIALSATFFDTYGYYDAGYIKKSNALSLKASYLVYFNKNKDHSGFFFYPMLKVRVGEVTIDDYGYYDNDSGEYINEDFTYDISGFSVGFGLGHKWFFNDKFSLGVSTEIARNLGNVDTFYIDNIEVRLGVNFGFRF